jgi:hypothetical protein
VKRRELLRKIERWDAYLSGTAGNMTGIRTLARVWPNRYRGIGKLTNFLRVPFSRNFREHFRTLPVFAPVTDGNFTGNGENSKRDFSADSVQMIFRNRAHRGPRGIRE